MPSPGHALTPWISALLFTNSCPGGRNNARPSAYLGASERPTLRSPAPNLNYRHLPPSSSPRGPVMRRTPFSRFSLCAAAFGALAVTAFVAAPLRAAEDAVIIAAPAADLQASDGIQTAVIAGGCFWGVQGVFQHTAGVLNAVSGYAG